MPTVLRVANLRVAVYPNDHRPPHVHVIGPDAEAAFELNCPNGPPVLRTNAGFTLGQLNRILKQIVSNLEELCHAWHQVHGNH